jgi:hypothetical protein
MSDLTDSRHWQQPEPEGAIRHVDPDRHVVIVGCREARKSVSDRHTVLAQRLYAESWSLARIGDRLHVDAHTVRRALTARGVRMRDTHARER